MDSDHNTELLERLRAETAEQTQALRQLGEGLARVEGRVHDINIAMCGQPQHGQWGLAQRVQETEKRIEAHGHRLTALERLGVILTFIGGVLVTFWDKLSHLWGAGR